MLDDAHGVLRFGDRRHAVIRGEMMEIGNGTLQQIDSLNGQSGRIRASQNPAGLGAEKGFRELRLLLRGKRAELGVTQIKIGVHRFKRAIGIDRHDRIEHAVRGERVVEPMIVHIA